VKTFPLHAGDMGVTILNSLNQAIPLTKTLTLEPHSMKYLKVNNRYFSPMEHLRIPILPNQSTLMIFYRTKKSYSIMPITLPKREKSGDGFAQIIHLNKNKDAIDLRARHGDYLQNIHYQQKSRIYQLAEGLNLVVDCSYDKKIWTTIEVEIKANTFHFILIVDEEDGTIIHIPYTYEK
jgi:hypothetical protein